jgi:DNA polymerase (family 10)
MENVEIASTLRDVADLLDIQGANPFRVRAYRNAARTVEEHTAPMKRLVAGDADLTELPGVGEDISGYIRELVETGSLALLDELAREVPPTLIEITRIQGVGPKKTKKLWEELGVETVDDLQEAAGAGKVQALDGFGAKTQEKILEGIEEYRRHQERFRLSEVDGHVAPLLEWMEGEGALERIEVAGSYRRRKETVGDIDLLAVADDGPAVMERFTAYAKVAEVDAAGDTRGTVRLTNGLQVDLRVVPEKSYGAALHYFTGSKEHNVRVRSRGVERGLRISEYGVFREEESSDSDEGGDGSGDDSPEDRDPWSGELVAGRTEEEVYEAVDLPWIPPELREDRGEIEAAEEGELPDLIELDDIRGDLQMHSTWSDGRNSVAEMMEACAARGYEYLAMTDHSQSLAMTGGLDEEKLRQQWEEMDGIAGAGGANGSGDGSGIRLFRSLEVDILKDGELDLSDEMLAELDIVLISVHSHFDLSSEDQTKRIIRAVRHPATDILAHPTGRRINKRDPYELDLDAVLDALADEGMAVELNANPERLDLKDTHLLKAREREIPVVISTDAHRTAELDLMRYGVEQARRAWLTPEHVLNTRPLEEMEAWLEGRKGG